MAQWGRNCRRTGAERSQGEILGEALGPINQRLASSALMTEWTQPLVDGDMSITSGGRSYALLGVREMADAMIAEAISHLSGVKLFVLDRVDVLDMAYARIRCTGSTAWRKTEKSKRRCCLQRSKRCRRALIRPTRCGSKTALPDGSGGRRRQTAIGGAYEIDSGPHFPVEVRTATRSSSRQDLARTGHAHALKKTEPITLAAAGAIDYANGLRQQRAQLLGLDGCGSPLFQRSSNRLAKMSNLEEGQVVNARVQRHRCA